MQTFKTPLQRIMKEEGRRQSWLARLLDVGEGQVSKWAHGKVTVPDHHRAAIAKALGRNVDEVFVSGPCPVSSGPQTTEEK